MGGGGRGRLLTSVTEVRAGDHDHELSQLSARGALQEGLVVGVDAGKQWRSEFPRVLTRQQAAELLQVQPRQLDVMGVPCLDLGHRTKRYLTRDVEAWLETHRTAGRRGA